MAKSLAPDKEHITPEQDELITRISLGFKVGSVILGIALILIWAVFYSPLSLNLQLFARGISGVLR